MTGRVLEVACDESGSEGEKLIGGNTDVFAHASVRLSLESAAHCVQEIRKRIRSPAQEYKANHLLREKHRPVLKWLLAPSGPIHGKGHVHLTDKAFLVVARLVDLMVPGGDEPAEATGVTLYRGRLSFGPQQWRAFLTASNNLMRAREDAAAADSFLRAIDTLRRAGGPGRVGDIIELLWRAGPNLPARLVAVPTMIPLDPLIPAIVQAVVYWSDGGKPVSIVHDRQTALTEERIAQLKGILAAGGRLAGLRFVDSRSDSRVQIADFLAGVARKIASDELNGRGDVELTALLRPYVDSFSIWGDDQSWSRLRPGEN